MGEIAVSSSGSQVQFNKAGGTGTLNFSLSRTIGTSGFREITLNLTAFQSNTGFESSDFLEVEYDLGAGFIPLIRDSEVWNGSNDLTGESTGGADGQTTATSTGDLILPVGAAGNAMLQIRIHGSLNANTEDYFLDHFTVSGAPVAIPEPSGMLLFATIAGLCIGNRLVQHTIRKGITETRDA